MIWCIPILVDKEYEYSELLKKRKKCRECMDYCPEFASNSDYFHKFISNQNLSNLINPSAIEKEEVQKWKNDWVEPTNWNPNVVSLWENWQGNLNAPVMVVGQDWGDINYYLRYGGNESGAIERQKPNPTNDHLIMFLSAIGYPILPPSINSSDKTKRNGSLFFVNAIQCLKSAGPVKRGSNNGLQAPVKEKWFKKCEVEFLSELIRLVNPSLIIPLGKRASISVLRPFEYKITHIKMRELVKYEFFITDNIRVCPVYHCGGRGLVNRKMDEQYDLQKSALELQLLDWMTITGGRELFKTVSI